MTDVASPGIVDAYPLTPVQAGILFSALRGPDAGLYVGRVSATIHGPLTEARACEAWQLLLDRHEALRTAFVYEGLDQPMQVVCDPCRIDFVWLGSAADEDKTAPTPEIGVTKPPLMHVRIIAEAQDRHRLDWSIHHLIADGWSVNVLLREFLEIVAAAEVGTAPALGPAPAFADHANWLASREPEDNTAYWTAYFEGLNLPPRSISTGPIRFGRAQRRAETTFDQVQEDARADGVTAATHLQAAFAKSLGRLTQRNDVIYGLANSGRAGPMAGIAECVGVFVNTLPVRVDLSDPSLLSQIDRTVRSLRAHEHVPPAVIARHAGLKPGQPLIDTVLTIRALPEISAAGPFSITDISVETPSDTALVIDVDPATFLITALFDTGVYSEPQIDAFLADFAREITDPQNVSEPLGLISGPALAEEPTDVLSRIEAHARLKPEADAIISGDSIVSREALMQRARGVAAHLRERGLGAGDIVALVQPRDPEMIICMIGALMAGVAYVPIDAGYPQHRIDLILDDCKPAAVISQGIHLRPAWIDGNALDAVEVLTPVKVAPSDLAYVIYTSGSTGRPKGVAVSRGALATSQSARDQFYGGAPEAFLLMSPYAFDSSVVGIFWALTGGARLVISAERAEQDVAALGQTISRHGVTHTLMLPSLYRALLDGADPQSLSTLTTVIVAGEVCPPSLPKVHGDLLPHCRLANEYGPTEATVWALADMIDPGEARPMTIGRPIPAAQIALLDDALKPVAVGERGEICIAGPILAAGYLGNARATAESFVTVNLGDGDPVRMYRTGDYARQGIDGRIAFLGRGDVEIKIRGHRVDLNEVETALATLPGVRDVAVFAEPARLPNTATLVEILDALPQDIALNLISEAEKAR